jgi:hypothetical protein
MLAMRNSSSAKYTSIDAEVGLDPPLLFSLVAKQGGRIPEQFIEEAFAIGGEAAHNLHWDSLLVGDFVERSVIEGNNSCIGIAEQDRGMSGDDELRVSVVVKSVVDEDEEGKLALWGERGFGFIEEKEARAAELVIEHGEEGLAMGPAMEGDSAIGVADETSAGGIAVEFIDMRCP